DIGQDLLIHGALRAAAGGFPCGFPAGASLRGNWRSGRLIGIGLFFILSAALQRRRRFGRRLAFGQCLRGFAGGLLLGARMMIEPASTKDGKQQNYGRYRCDDIALFYRRSLGFGRSRFFHRRNRRALQPCCYFTDGPSKLRVSSQTMVRDVEVWFGYGL